MSDKWMSAEDFTDRVEEIYDKLSGRWENVHPCDVNHGFFYCCDDADHKEYMPHTCLVSTSDAADHTLPLDSCCCPIFKQKTRCTLPTDYDSDIER